jgi:hypothetical protein
MLPHIGRAAAPIPMLRNVAARGATAAAVKTGSRSRSVAADVDDQPLSWGDRDNGAYTPTVGYR